MGNKIKNRKINDLHFDNRNINKGSKYGMELLGNSIQEVGLVRAIATDKNDVIIAGNKTAQMAGELGIERVVEIETTGKELIVVKRTDLDINEELGIKAKIFDNTVSRHNYVQDAEVVQVMCEEADIVDIKMYGLGERQEDEQEDGGKQSVSFSASKTPVVKIELPAGSDPMSVKRDVEYLMNQKYPGAIVTVKGGK